MGTAGSSGVAAAVAAATAAVSGGQTLQHFSVGRRSLTKSSLPRNQSFCSRAGKSAAR